ncbi:radical SAM/SPASM domain-containing protein [Agathobacter rectalis]|jgi:radical SAM domain protein|uniref:radical SAM/SPASM domain-containing protein n=1 Tax=Agathobacter rectalis TaxID=39491 RepID=UPI00302B4106
MELHSDIFSTDFNSYTNGYKDAKAIKAELMKADLLPNYYSAPLFVMWELTSKCPNRCIYCYNNSNSEKHCTNELTTEEAMAFAEQLVKAKPFSVCLTGGEPTTRKDYFQIANYLKENMIPVSTVTSGYLVDDEMAKKMCECFEYVQVSVDGPDAETHDKVRGVAGSFERAVQACKLLKKHGVHKLSIAVSLCKYNKDKFEEMLDFAKDFLQADELRTQYLVMVGRAGDNENIELSKEEYQEVINCIERKQNEFMTQGEAFKVLWGDPCVHILIGKEMSKVTLLRLTSEGRFAISPYLPYVMGNVRNSTLQEIWTGGMRTGWDIPSIAEAVKDIESLDDVKELSKKLGNDYIDVL